MEKGVNSTGEGGNPLIRLDSVTKVYPLPAGDVTAIDRLSLEVERGDFVAVMGVSGSGKSTLLNLIGCLDVPTSGDLYLNGVNIRDLADDPLTELRRDTIGFVFQQFNLIPLLTAYENVEFPLILAQGGNGGPVREEIVNRCRAVLASVGLDESLATHKPSELSGGQQQRVAIARALVNDPDILLCDEPTGNLDTRTGTTIMELLAQMNRGGKTIIMVTHDPRVAGYARRRIELVDGRLA
ncbi:MAG: ABC transporter ATP-binding protein [Methanomicrobiales archaeon]|nr:ABC transporter ATP-binding protein [Methanomicrobiales archaeon]